jgi:putative membrane protein
MDGLWDDRAMVRRLFGLLVPFLGSAAAVYLSTRLFDQDRFDHVVSLKVASGDLQATAQTIAIVTVIFGLVNLLVKPVVRLLTFPIRILTFGLFSLIINGGMLLLTGFVAERVNAPFHVALSPWVIAAAAVIGIAAGIFNWLGDKITSRARTKVKVDDRVVERGLGEPAPQYRRAGPVPTNPTQGVSTGAAHDVWKSTGNAPPPPPPPQRTPPPPQRTPPPAPPQYGPPNQYVPPPPPGQTYGPGQGGGYGPVSGYGEDETYGQGSTYGPGQ